MTTFSKLSYIFLICTLKCAANYVIYFEVYDGFICQKILKLGKQESWPFGPGRAANIPKISSCTSYVKVKVLDYEKLPTTILEVLQAELFNSRACC